MLCPDRFSAFIAGIGSGKSYAGAVKGLVTATRTGGLGLIIAPTYPMLRDATLRTFQLVAGAAITEYRKSEMIATLRGGLEVMFRSADNPDSLRGEGLDLAILDECAFMQVSAWS